MTNAMKRMMAGPVRRAISKNLCQSGPLRLSPWAGDGAVRTPSPAWGADCGTIVVISRPRSSSRSSVPSALGGRVVHGLDDAGGVTLAGQHVHDAGVEGVAHALPVE